MNGKPGDMILYATKSLSRYEESLSNIISYISMGRLNECKIVIVQIKKIIKDKSIEPSQKLLALELLQACMLLNKPEFIAYAQTKILQRLGELAQKDSKNIFKDSSQTVENKLSSERFRNNLLNYIYIWANEYGQTPDRKPSEYAKLFYKLREIVTFPSPKPKESLRRSLTTAVKKPSSAEGRKKLDLDYLENLLEVLEQIVEPNSNEAGREMMMALAKLQPDFDRVLNTALSSNKQTETERLLRINDRIMLLISPDINERRRKTEENFPQLELNRGSSVPAPVGNVFEDIINLEEESGSVLPLESVFRNEPQPPDSSPFMSKFLQEIKPSSESIATDSRKRSSSKNSIEDSDLLHEIDTLKKRISEKHIDNYNLKQSCLSYQDRLSNLESVLQKTKELLFSKEKECEEYHCLKKDALEYPEILLPAESTFHGTYATTGVPLGKSLVSSRPTQDSEFDIRYACCDASPVLLSNEIFELTFQGALLKNQYKLTLFLANKASVLLENIEFDIENAFGFNIKISSQDFTELSPGGFGTMVLASQFICPTHIAPTIILKLTYNVKRFNYCIKLPVSICKFSTPIEKNFFELWGDWELLAFDNESTTCRLEHPLDRCTALVKLSQNAIVLTNASTKNIQENQCMVIIQLSKIVFGLLTLKSSERMIEIEIRCDLATLRKSILLLILRQISAITN